MHRRVHRQNAVVHCELVLARTAGEAVRANGCLVRVHALLSHGGVRGAVGGARDLCLRAWHNCLVAGRVKLLGSGVLSGKVLRVQLDARLERRGGSPGIRDTEHVQRALEALVAGRERNLVHRPAEREECVAVAQVEHACVHAAACRGPCALHLHFQGVRQRHFGQAAGAGAGVKNGVESVDALVEVGQRVVVFVCRDNGTGPHVVEVPVSGVESDCGVVHGSGFDAAEGLLISQTESCMHKRYYVKIVVIYHCWSS